MPLKALSGQIFGRLKARQIFNCSWLLMNDVNALSSGSDPQKTLSAQKCWLSVGRHCGADEIDWKFSCVKLTVSTLAKHLGLGFKPEACELTLASYYWGDPDNCLNLHCRSKIAAKIEKKLTYYNFGLLTINWRINTNVFNCYKFLSFNIITYSKSFDRISNSYCKHDVYKATWY